jgi:cobalt-zinc-cadmium efflux system protein
VHSHHHHHAHAHSAGRAANRRKMAIALAINIGLVAAGVAGALLFDSVALLADAGHVLSDAASIGIGLAAAAMAARPARGRRTFGFHRTEIFAALVNGLVLAGVAVFVLVEAIGRLSDPPDVKGAGVIVVGAIGLAGNVAATLALVSGDRRDLNLEAVLRHSAGDALGSLGVVIAGAVVLITGWGYADPIAAILISALIIASSWSLVREAVNVLMEAAPAGIDVQAVGQAMAAVPGVREVHDLHVWTVTSGFPALAAHVITAPDEDVDDVRARVEAVLHESFEIDHTTLQMMAERLLTIEGRGDL